MDEVPALIEAAPHEEHREEGKVPITIITGFLGSGKTTLLQHILGGDHGLKVAVLMNEFGESSELERMITSQRAGRVADEWIEFDNGCLCCSAKDAAMIAIESLLKQRQDIQHIVIETSGMAHPGPIIQRLWADEALECRAELDGVVCLVDGVHGLGRLDGQGSDQMALTQVALADMTLLNKSDLSGEDVIERLSDVVKALNPFCQIETTAFSQVPVNKVLNLGEYRHKQKTERDPSALLALLSLSHGNGTKKLRSFAIEVPFCLPISVFEIWFFTLLWEGTLIGHDERLPAGTEIMRVKGVLYGASHQGRTGLYALQAVEQMYELVTLDGVTPASDFRCRLVFIGTFTTEAEAMIKAAFLAYSSQHCKRT